MKKIRIKLLSLALTICICLSFFTGCSLFTTSTEGDNDAVTLKIAGQEISKQELIDAYYSFYQQNQHYFMYYDTETIMNVFYNSIVAKEVVLLEAEKLLDSGVIKFSQEDYDDIWNDVFDYVYSQVDTKEKNILLLEDSNEENLPARLQDEDDDDKETPYKYEPYVCEKLIKIDNSSVTEALEADINVKIRELKEGIYTYNAATEEDERDMQPIQDSEKAKRLEAFEKYLSDLVFSAKANGKEYLKDVVLQEEVERIYTSYYENALYEKYQELVESTAGGFNYEGLTNYEAEDGLFVDKLSSAIIEEKYTEILNQSAESNSVYENYVSVITSSDNESLILYHHDGKYTYFTVQHILVAFDDETLEILKNTDGYDTSKDAIFREPYEAIRATYSNDDDMKTSYRDEEGYTVKDSEGNELKVSVTEIRSAYYTELANRISDFVSKSGNLTDEERELGITRVRTLLFNEFAWKYSGDTGSLTNDELSGVLGFTISSETDEHGSFVKDFTNGARELYEAYLANPETNGIGVNIASVVSDYGTHMMMLTGVYEAGKVAETLEDLEKTYVSNLTEQTLYEYVYDIVKEELVGDSGTYFTKYRNSLVNYYNEENLIEWVDKMTYEELTEAIS